MKLSEQTFFGEFNKFLNKVREGTNFALVRFGDGEMRAMNGEYFVSGNGEWQTEFLKTNTVVNLLRQSFTYKDDEYYVGIVCPCCQGRENFVKMADASEQEEDNLTFANVFVNSNWKHFRDHFLPSLKERKVFLVTHKNSVSNLTNLPFDGIYIQTEDNAWVEDFPNLLNELLYHAQNDNNIFLISAGPYANILVNQLWQFNKNNTYIDVGSALSYWLKSDFHNPRGFYTEGSYHYNLECKWRA